MPSKNNRGSFNRYLMPVACMILALGGCSPPKIHPIYDRIEKEKKDLPDKVAAESLSLSADFLRTPMIVELLSDRNVKMLEITPVRSWRDPQLSALGSDERLWTMPVALFKFVQLRLSAKGDATCIPDDTLTPRLRELLASPPIATGTCLTMTISPVSSAQYAIRLRKREGDMPFDRWELVETASNSIAASMSTSETELRAAPNRDLRQFYVQFPHTNLLRLVDRSGETQAVPDRFYMKRAVTASAHPDPEISGKTGAEVPVSIRRVSYQKPKTGFLSSEDWPKAVTDARASGWGYYHRDLLEQASGVRWNLNLNMAPDGNGVHIDTSVFNVEAGDRGFYVSPESFNPAKRRWLSHYDAKGQLLWQVFVANGADLFEKSCSVRFELARTTAQEIVFKRNCYGNDAVEGIEQVEELFIKKKDIATQLGRANLNEA